MTDKGFRISLGARGVANSPTPVGDESRYAAASRWVTASLVGGLLVACGDYSDRTATPGPAATTPADPSPVSPAGTTTTAPGPAETTAPAETTTPGPAETTAPAPDPNTPAPEAVCEPVTVCGGDVVGTWTATGSCLTVDGSVDMSGFGLGCTEAATTGELEVSGSWTFSADGMVTDETVTTGNQTIDLQPECLMVSGTVTACDRVGGAMTTIGFTADTVCTDDAATGGCSCPAAANQMGGAASLAMRSIKAGTYTTADNVLSVKDNRNNLNEYGYCVQGDYMVVSLKSLPKAGPVAGQVVFKRQ